MMNRHGLIAGATGAGKTRTLQAKAEADAAAAKEQTQSERTTSSRSSHDSGGIIETVVKSSGFNSFLRSADTVLGREITRTIFGTRSRRPGSGSDPSRTPTTPTRPMS